MPGSAVLEAIRRRGGDISAEGNRLHYRGPQLAADHPLRAAIAEHRAALLLRLEAEQARAAVEAIAAEGRRRWARAEQLEQSGDPEDCFLAEHHRSEVRLMVTRDWLPAIQRLARAQQALGRLVPELAYLTEGAAQDGAQP